MAKLFRSFALTDAHRGASDLAKLGAGEGLGLASTNQQQTLGFESGGLVQKRGFQRLAGDFAGGDEVGGS